MFHRWRVALLVAAVVVVATAVPSLADTQDVGIDSSVQHASGVMQSVDPETGRKFLRSVEAFYAPSGAYRVVVRSLDGSGAAEEVAYDGRRTQTVLVTEPGGHQELYALDSSAHFAVDPGQAAARGWEVRAADGGIVTDSAIGAGRFAARLRMGVMQSVPAGEARLAIQAPPGLEPAESSPATRRTSPPARTTRSTCR